MESFTDNEVMSEYHGHSTLKRTKLVASQIAAIISKPLFVIFVAAPTLISLIYFSIVASDVYLSESQFIVRSPSQAAASPLGVILSAGGVRGSSEEANVLVEYVRSRDALEEADVDGYIRKAYGRKSVSTLERFGGVFGRSTREHLYKFYLGKVGIENDPALQITRLQVRAYTPEEAQRINQRLLQQSERLVNRLSNRARSDAITIAESEVKQAQGRVKETALNLSRFRDSERIIDPEQEAEIRLQMISKLQDDLISTRAQLEQIQSLSSKASQIPYLRARVKSVEREIGEQSRSIAGGYGSLSTTVVQYQKLRLDTDLAAKQLAAAYTSLEEAKAEARRKRAYVERISEPSLPDYAEEPRRWRSIFATFILSLLAWGVVSTLIAGVREHRD